MNHHYYASSAYGWSIGATRGEAIRKVLRDYGSPQVGNAGGFWVWSCRVDLPSSATYTIMRYSPHRITKRATDGELAPTDDYVPMSEQQEGQYKTQKGGHVVRLEVVRD